MIAGFPVEIYIEILKSLPTSADGVGITTLLSFLEANTVTRAAALTATIWRAHYRSRYTNFVEEKETQRFKDAEGDWRLMYIARRKLDNEAMVVLDDIRRLTGGLRQELATLFTQKYSYDVFDMLRLETQLPIPDCFRPDSPANVLSCPDFLVERETFPRRFWAQTILGVMARYDTLRMWARIHSDPQSVSFEEALAGLSAFFDVLPSDIYAQLDGIYRACRSQMELAGIQLDQAKPDYDIWEVCLHIRQELRRLGFCLAEGPLFSRVTNQFPHSFLPEGRRATIPISLVYVFVAVARRLGIMASPTNYPGAVQAHISSPDPAVPSRMLDMCGDKSYVILDPVILAAELNIPISRATIEIQHLQPAGPAIMLQRAANNMTAFIQHEIAHDLDGTMDIELHENASYAASQSSLIQTHNPQYVYAIRPPIGKPLDSLAVLRDALYPALDAFTRTLTISVIEQLVDEDKSRQRLVRARSDTPNVKYFVGAVFQHSDLPYAGCIYDWQPFDDPPEEQLNSIRIVVHHLPPTNDQPHYVALTTDGMIKYVAQEKINLCFPSLTIVNKLYNSRKSIFSRYFTGVDVDDKSSRGRLRLSTELRTKYPEDDLAGSSWVRSGTL